MMRKTLYLSILLAMVTSMATAAVRDSSFIWPADTATAITEYPYNDNILPKLNEATAFFEKFDEEGTLLDNVSPEDLVKLPLGVSRTLSNVTYTLGITEVKFNPNYAEFTAFMRIKIPQKKDLFFGAYGVKLSRTGGLIGDVKLALLGDFSIDLGGGKSTLILKGAFDANNNMVNGGVPVTYCAIDCNGFKELSIAADVLFSRELLIPADANGKQLATGQVKGSFKTVASDWNDILVNISLPAFQIKGLNDFTFTINTAVFDFSDLHNDPATVFPANYLEQYMPPDNPGLWRGVSISSLKVDLPDMFKRGDDGKRINVEGKNILIDNQGFTGLVTANNIVTLGEGESRHLAAFCGSVFAANGGQQPQRRWLWR